MSSTAGSYAEVMARSTEIMRGALGIDYDAFVTSPIAFDYDAMMDQTGYSLEDIARIQAETKVGRTLLGRQDGPAHLHPGAGRDGAHRDSSRDGAQVRRR
jgi:hypothetical protein